MKFFSVNKSNNIDDIKCILIHADSPGLVVLVGGDGDTKDTYLELGKEISRDINKDLLLFSFRGRESINKVTPEQMIRDLEELLDYIIKKFHYEEISLLCTSSGSVSTTFVLSNKKFSQYIMKAIYLDPADYYLSREGREIYPDTWNGQEEYRPVFPTISLLMSDIKGGVTIHIVYFSIRNYENKSYVEPNLRGIDNPHKYSRLNRNMVRNFYNAIPIKNKGEYLEVNQIPHAFLRDGNLSNNFKKVRLLIKDLF